MYCKVLVTFLVSSSFFFFFFQAEDGIRDIGVTGVQTCALPISATQAAAAQAERPSAVSNVFCGGHDMRTVRAAGLGGSHHPLNPPAIWTGAPKIGRASCRERV